MDKELIDYVWRHCLPKEFKEEVQKVYCTPGHRAEVYMLLRNLFGAGNLTSDAEGEEMLTVSRRRVQEVYSYNEEILSHDPTHRGAILLKKKLTDLFGSKCLPDELTEDNFAKLHGDNLSPEPKAAPIFADAAPTFADDCKSRPDRMLPSYTSQPVTNCHRSDRLHIAAMSMQALLSNADRMKRYEEIASYPLSDNLTRIVARNALRYADALVAEAHKPTQC